MPYTRTWDEVNNLPGSRDADEIDDASRETHLDLTERFDDIIKGGAAADPWVLKTTGLISRYSWAIGTPAPPSSGLMSVGSAVGPNDPGAAQTIFVPIIVPKGSKLLQVSFRLRLSGAGASAVATVYKLFADGSTAVVGTPASPGGTIWTDALVGPVLETAGDGESFMAFVTLENGTLGTFARFGTFEVTLGAD